MGGNFPGGNFPGGNFPDTIYTKLLRDDEILFDTITVRK